jgi:ATP-dependent helicase/nuclease subunit B
MASIARISIDAAPGARVSWRDIVTSSLRFLMEQGVAVQDTIVLVPFTQHLPLARRAWAECGGWLPRIETTHTLAQSLGPRPVSDDAQLSFDAGLDRLAAARLLRGQAWAATWARRDARSFDDALKAMVSTAHAIARAAFALPPDLRAEHWQQARALLAPLQGPGGTERALAQIALEWAATSAEPVTDRLFSLQPSAWIVVQAGGHDALAQQLMAAALPSVVCGSIDADTLADIARLTLGACDGFEHEAQCTAAQVLDHLEKGRAPVALVAEDRVLVRRVRALLERQNVPLLDETGWKLSTTRAAAQVLSLLRAAAPNAPMNVVLDWLKTTPTRWPSLHNASSAGAAFEAFGRRAGWRQRLAITPERLPPAAAELWATASRALSALTETGRQPLQRWFAALRSALQITGTWESLLADAAGQQVAAALRLTDGAGVGSSGQTPMTLDELTAWIDGVLEDASYIPPSSRQPLVVITPMSRVALRPFEALVLPGADERHLAAGSGPHSLLSDEHSLVLGLPTRQQRHEAEALHFAHTLSVPHVNLFHRRVEGREPLAVSPLVERLVMARQRAGDPIEDWLDLRPTLALMPTPVHMPAPSAASLLPGQMSASACEALRACPYRFHALYQLGLREADELDDEIAKRDYGTWLHAVLYEFHVSRVTPSAAVEETTRLMEIAELQRVAAGLSDADFLPYAASFQQLAPRYVEWLHQRDSAGAQWWKGEDDRRIEPPVLGGLMLQGRIDRADRISRDGQAAIELIDYKTGSAEALKQQVKQPFEDTQLAFYAALMRDHANEPLAASYLALDSSKGIEVIVHRDVEESAQALLAGLAHDLVRLRAGAGLPALGEGSVCDFCSARGLCRKDQWTATESEAA